MRITILASGSRGDVQPFIALAYALAQAGHTPCVVSNANFEPLIRQYGLDFRPLRWDAQESLRTAPLKFEPGELVSDIGKSLRVFQQVYEQVQSDSWRACQEAEYLVYSLLAPWGQSIAEKLNIPAAVGFLHPMYPTRAFPFQFVPFNLGGTLNYASANWISWLMGLMLGPHVNRFRRVDLGLPPLRLPANFLELIPDRDSPLLYSLSPTIIPRPADWPARVHMDGYWFLPPPPAWQPPPALVDFIQPGTPPVFIGFGSMVYKNAGEVGQLVIAALQKAGMRGVLSRGWGGLQLEDYPETVFLVDDVPHEWLFPQMAAVVHHGGAGTTAAGLRAGVPSIVVPYMQDQPYWGRKLYQLGVGPRPIPYRQLTAASLAERLLATRDEAMRARSRQIGEQIRNERGVERAVEVLEAYFAHGVAEGGGSSVT